MKTALKIFLFITFPIWFVLFLIIGFFLIIISVLEEVWKGISAAVDGEKEMTKEEWNNS